MIDTSTYPDHAILKIEWINIYGKFSTSKALAEGCADRTTTAHYFQFKI